LLLKSIKESEKSNKVDEILKNFDFDQEFMCGSPDVVSLEDDDDDDSFRLKA